MFKDYDRKIKMILLDSGKSKKTDWKVLLEKHQVMISRIQHERLIHLLVTIFVGISMVSFFIAGAVSRIIILSIIDLPLIILFVAYIFHYRSLENKTQNWYKLEDQIKEKVS